MGISNQWPSPEGVSCRKGDHDRALQGGEYSIRGCLLHLKSYEALVTDF